MYTVWKCCGDYDQHDTKQEAFDDGYYTNESDYGHRVVDIEGPNGEDLTEEYEHWYDKKSGESTHDYIKMSQEYEKKKIGTVDVKSPEGRWCPQTVYNDEERAKLVANGLAAYGPDRVRFTPKPKS